MPLTHKGEAMIPVADSSRRVEVGISWRSLFLGLFVGLALQFLLTMLGIAIGLTAFDVTSSGTGLGVGAAIWAALVPIVSWFFGAWVAAYSSGALQRGTGLLHGLGVWAIGLLAAMWLFGAGIGGAVGGVLGFAGQGAQAVGESGLVDQGQIQQQQQQLEQQLGQLGAQDAQTATDVAAGGAWALFIAALLAFAASLLGGVMGTRSLENRVVDEDRRRVPPATPPLQPRTT